jgi:hypothetical protein
MHDTKDVGQDKTHKDVADKYDANHGKYTTDKNDLDDSALPTGNMPMAPDPSPFKLGPNG